MDISKHLRDISKEEAIQSYHDLQENLRSPDFSRIGLKALDYFFFITELKRKQNIYHSMRQ